MILNIKIAHWQKFVPIIEVDPFLRNWYLFYYNSGAIYIHNT